MTLRWEEGVREAVPHPRQSRPSTGKGGAAPYKGTRGTWPPPRRGSAGAGGAGCAECMAGGPLCRPRKPAGWREGGKEGA